MKFIKFVLIFAIICSQIGLAEQIDVTKKPEPLSAKELPFPKHVEKTLKNGLKVLIIEDNEQPLVTLNLLIAGGTSMSGKKPGIAELTASMLTKGAGKLTAQEIAAKIDGLGASLSANASVDYLSVSAFSLKKHIKTVLDLFANVVMKPTFPAEELEKLKPQFIAEIQNEKSETGTLAATLSRIAVYGENHPYSFKMTEASINQIEVADIEAYYKKYFVPNNATIAVVGDVKANEIVQQLEKAIGDWKKGNPVEIKIPEPKSMPLGVYFVARPASVQSTVIVTSKTVPYTDPEYETLTLAAGVMGSGFGGRLFRTLREEYSYTYSPFGYQTRSKYFNRFTCGSDVRNSVTDSSISVILDQLSALASTPPTEEELSRIKRYSLGRYLNSFEDSEFIATLIQNADFYGIPINVVKGYPQRFMSISRYSTQRSAERYMNPKSSYIIVAGNPDIKDKLERFGKVYEFSMDMEPMSGEKAKMEKVSMTPNELIAKYRKAIGGDEAIAATQTMTIEGKISMNSNGSVMNGVIRQKSKFPDKSYMYYNFDVYAQELWINAGQAWMKGAGEPEKLPEDDADKMVFTSIIFNFARLMEFAQKAEVIGEQSGNIVMKAIFKGGFERIFYFDKNTYLINKVEYTENTPQGNIPITEKYSDYFDYNGIKMPRQIETVSTMYSMSSKVEYRMNEQMEDTIFAPVK